MGLAIIFIIPILIEEIQKFFQTVPAIKAAVMKWVEIAQQKMIEYGLVEEEKFLDEKILAGVQNVLEAIIAGAVKLITKVSKAKA